MDVSKMSDSELVALYREQSAKEVRGDGMQMAMKILLNAGYGAVGNANFIYYKRENAAAITSMGRYVNQYTSSTIEAWLKDMLGDDKPIHIAGDTDSVTGDSVIYVNGESVTIEEFYNSVSGMNALKWDIFNKNFVKWVDKDSCYTYSVSEDGKLNTNQIKYVMKHMVKKVMFRITVDSKSVEVTEDHSIIVKRGDVLLSVKPGDMCISDVIITLSNDKTALKYHETYTIESLGKVEQFVYDIEVEGDHNFFANDILVHNSMYLQLSKLVDIQNLSDKDAIVDNIDLFCNSVIDPKIDEISNDIKDYLNSYEQRMIWNREVIAECFHPSVLVEGKRIDQLYHEGVFIQEGVVKRQVEVSAYQHNDDAFTRTNSDYICRKMYDGDMICITLEDGRSIQLTPDHEVFYYSEEGEVLSKQAKYLTLEDDIVVQ